MTYSLRFSKAVNRYISYLPKIWKICKTMTSIEEKIYAPPSEDKLGSGDIPIYTKTGGNFSIPNSSMLLLCRDVLAKGFAFRLCAPGFSMTPFICDRDIITLEPCQVNSYSRGDVIGHARSGPGNFCSSPYCLLHR